MKWFKHYTHVGNDSRLIQLKNKMGYRGMGFYWAIVEVICNRSCGRYPRQEILALRSHEFPGRAINEILDNFGLFVTDEEGLVSMMSLSAQKRSSDVPSTDTQLDLNSTSTRP